jgi:hypothetical protein
MGKARLLTGTRAALEQQTATAAQTQGSGRQQLSDELATSQATNGTKAAQMASKPSAIPVAVKYARIVSTPSQLGQEWRPRSHDAVTWETACWLFATEPFTQA